MLIISERTCPFKARTRLRLDPGIHIFERLPFLLPLLIQIYPPGSGICPGCSFPLLCFSAILRYLPRLGNRLSQPPPALLAVALSKGGHIMPDTEYTEHVSHGEDGAYRWYYDLNMYRNRYLLNVILKVIGIIALISYPFLFYWILHGGLFLNVQLVLLVSLPFVACILLTLIIYYIVALVKHGTYRLYFMMDDTRICLVRKATTQDVMNATADIASLLSLTNARALSAAASSGLTPYNEILSLRDRPKYDAFNLTTYSGANQIFVNKDDYAFVRQFVYDHMSEKSKRRSEKRPKNRLLLSATLSLVICLIALTIGGYAYLPESHRFIFVGNRLPFFKTIPSTLLTFVLLALVLWLLLTLFDVIKKSFRGE